MRTTSLRPTSFRQILHHRARSAAAFLIGFVVAAAVLLAIVTPIVTSDSGGTSYEPTRVEVLIQRHDCWTGKAPRGVVPSRAVVTPPDGRPKLVPAQVGFDIWLEDAPGTLHGFCP